MDVGDRTDRGQEIYVLAYIPFPLSVRSPTSIPWYCTTRIQMKCQKKTGEDGPKLRRSYVIRKSLSQESEKKRNQVIIAQKPTF